jgi:hypothetical protein
MPNPMTTAADLIIGGTGGAPARLGVGSDGQGLRVVSGVPAWGADAGMTNPMTTAADLIIGGTGGAPARLAAGTEGHGLRIVSGVPTWAALPGSVPTAAVTASSTANLDAVVASGQLLEVDASSADVTITLRAQADFAYAAGFHFWILATTNANVTTLAKPSGVNLYDGLTDGSITLTAGTVYLVWRRGTNNWRVIAKS